MPKAKKKPAAKKIASKQPKKKAVKKVAAKRKVKKVLALPKGYSNVTPYLIVNHAAKAIEFYKKVFDAKVKMRMDKPDGKVCHAELKIGDTMIMLADECPEMNARSPEAYGGSPIGIHLYVKDVDGVVKRATTAGAKLLRDVENMFYGDRSGAVQDPFGHKWYVSTHFEDVTPAQMKKRVAELFNK
jgi:PhnB protein